MVWSNDRPKLRVRRALLLTLGEGAGAVGSRVLAAAEIGAAATLPVQWVPGDGLLTGDPDGTLAAMTAACDTLATLARLEALGQEGYALAQADELDLWLLIDAGLPDDGDPAVESPAPAAAGSDGRLPGSEALLSLVARFTALAWQRLRIQAVVRVLLLAEPAAEPQVAAWVQRLQGLDLERVYLAGPVNVSHTWLARPQWLERLAVALTAILWSTRAGETVPTAGPASDCPVYALGGAAWPSCRTALVTWLALYRARGLAQAVATDAGESDRAAELDSEARDVPLPAAFPVPDPDAFERDLAAVVGLPSSPSVSRDRRPAPGALATLAEALRDAAESAFKRRASLRQEAAAAWLDAQVAVWQERLRGQRRVRLNPLHGRPRLRQAMHDLERGLQDLQATLAAVEDRLEDAHARVEATQQGADHAQAALQQFCAQFPAATAAGVWQLVRQPWRWPRWGWDYFVELPVYRRQCVDAALAYNRSRWQEEVVHTLRQTYSALAQVVQKQRSEIDALQRALGSAIELLGTRLAGQNVDELLPWDTDRLPWLLAQLLGERAEGDWSPPHGVLLEDFLSQPADEVVEQLFDQATAELTRLEGWSALQCLTTALPGELLASWLDGLVEQAQPLWPSQALRAQTAVDTWLIAQGPAVLDDGDGPAAAAWQRLQAWGQARPALQWGAGVLDGLFCLCRMQVDLALQAEQTPPAEQGSAA